jgi:transposase
MQAAASPRRRQRPAICPKARIALADRAKDADWIRDVIEDQGCKACIPPKANRADDIPYSKHTYKKRNLIERFVCLALNYLAMAKPASIRLWLRHNGSAA